MASKSLISIENQQSLDHQVTDPGGLQIGIFVLLALHQVATKYLRETCQMTYGQDDYARRAEEQRRADEARRFEDQRQQEQKRYEQQKADDDRRFYERKLETERQNQAYADRKKREGAEIDARDRRSEQDADQEHRAAQDAYHHNLNQQDRYSALESERIARQQQPRGQQRTAGRYTQPPVYNSDGAGIVVLVVLGLTVWGLWVVLAKFWLFIEQWQLYDIPLRWVGFFYHATLKVPLDALEKFSGGYSDTMAWTLGVWAIGALVALIGLGLLIQSKRARRIFAVALFVVVTPAAIGGLWLLLPPQNAQSVRAWIKTQPFYTAPVNGAEIDASIVELATWLGCHPQQEAPFPSAAVNILARGKVLAALPLKAQEPSDQSPRKSAFKPLNIQFSLAAQQVREIRLTEDEQSRSIEVDFFGKPGPVSVVNGKSQYKVPVRFFPDGEAGGKFAYSYGDSWHRETPKGKTVGYQNVLRADKSGFTVRCSQK